jgi:hypothetical protein
MDSELSLTGVDLGEIAGRGCQGGALGVLVPSRNRPGQTSDLGEPPPESDSYYSHYLFTAVTNFRHFFGGDGSKDESDKFY